LVIDKIESKSVFSEEATQEIKEMFDITMEAFKYSLNALASIDYEHCKTVMNYEEEIDKMYKMLRKNHIERLNNFICDPNSGIVFLDIISNLERIGDHSLNIAESILEVI
jgi:phosphate:Na+ symporter